MGSSRLLNHLRSPHGVVSSPRYSEAIMKRLALPFALLALASCAPTVTGPITGRIVNGKTGQEGSVSFTRGTLKPRLDGPNAADNAFIQIGGQSYVGRTVLINVTTAAPTTDWGFGLSFGSGGPFRDGVFGWDTRWGRNNFERTTVSRTGNLIARTSGPVTLTLTCNLNVDVYEHGVGECTGNDGTKYAMQF